MTNLTTTFEILTSDLSNLDNLITSGYYATGDGGSALWNKTGFDSNKAGTIDITSKHRLELYDNVGNKFRYSEKFINARALGAKGNGVDDDGDLIRSIINASNLIAESKDPSFNDKIYFPSGVYLFSGKINFLNNSSLVGESADQTVFKKLDNTSVFMLRNSSYYAHFKIDANQQSYGIDIEQGAGKGIKHCTLRDIKIVNFNLIGLNAKGFCFDLVLEGIKIDMPEQPSSQPSKPQEDKNLDYPIGILLKNDSSPSVTLTNCSIYGHDRVNRTNVSGTCLHVNGIGGLTVVSPEFVSCKRWMYLSDCQATILSPDFEYAGEQSIIVDSQVSIKGGIIHSFRVDSAVRSWPILGIPYSNQGRAFFELYTQDRTNLSKIKSTILEISHCEFRNHLYKLNESNEREVLPISVVAVNTQNAHEDLGIDGNVLIHNNSFASYNNDDYPSVDWDNHIIVKQNYPHLVKQTCFGLNSQIIRFKKKFDCTQNNSSFEYLEYNGGTFATLPKHSVIRLIRWFDDCGVMSDNTKVYIEICDSDGLELETKQLSGEDIKNTSGNPKNGFSIGRYIQINDNQLFKIKVLSDSYPPGGVLAIDVYANH